MFGTQHMNILVKACLFIRVILVDLLCKMCKVQFVKQAATNDGVNCVNDKEIKNTLLAAQAMKEKLSVAC